MTVLFRWPEAAAVGRVIPKERLYAEAGVTKATRQRFIDEIQRVRWAYKLSEDSLRLRGRDDVAEVQVFELELKGPDVSESVLTSIDKSVPSPIIFELHRSLSACGEVQLAAARKEAGPRGPKLSGYFKGDWVPADAKRSALPPSIDLAGLYAQILTALMPLQVRSGEELSGAIDRMARIRKLEREIAALHREVRTEPQFNRKVELRRDLKTRQAELATLTSANQTTTEDATWRS
jgi:hypothetical protein